MAKLIEKQRAWRIVAGLVVAHVALHAMAWWRMPVGFSSSYVSPSDFLLYALNMLALAQSTLLVIWAALGGGKSFWRVPVVALVAIIYLWSFSETDGQWLVYALTQMGMSLAVFLAARCSGLQLAWCPGPARVARPFQFTLRDMFVWTTAIAVVLSLWCCVPTTAWSAARQSDLRASAVGQTVIAGVSMFCILGRRWIIARVVSLPVAVILLAILWQRAIGGIYLWFLTILSSFMAFWFVASFLALHFAGYRLAWRPQLAMLQEDIAA
jgi:hypothetical protein